MPSTRIISPVRARANSRTIVRMRRSQTPLNRDKIRENIGKVTAMETNIFQMSTTLP